MTEYLCLILNVYTAMTLVVWENCPKSKFRIHISSNIQVDLDVTLEFGFFHSSSFLSLCILTFSVLYFLSPSNTHIYEPLVYSYSCQYHAISGSYPNLLVRGRL